MTRVLLALAALALGVLVPASAAPVDAVFTSTSGNTGSALSADVLTPPTNLTAGHACTATAPTLVATATAGGRVSSIEVARPAAVKAGDVVIVMLMHHDSSSEPQTRSTDGWAQTARANGSSQGQGLMVLKVATASEPISHLFSGLDSSDATGVLLLVYRGVDTAAPWAGGPHTQLNQTATTTVTAAAVSPAVAPTRLVAGLLVDDYAGTISTPTGTTRATEISVDAPQPVSMVAVDRVLTVTGSSGTTQGTITTTEKSYGFSVALSAAPPSYAVTLSWVPTTDLYATGYEGYRSDYPTVFAVGGARTLSSYTDTSLGAAGATYYIRSAAPGTWRSAFVSVTVPPC